MAERLTAIIAIQNELIAADFDLEVVFSAVVDRAQRLTGAGGAVVELADGSDLVYRAVTGTGASHLGTRVPQQGSLAGLCLRTSEVLICHDTEEDERVHRDACRLLGIRSMVVVPLHHGSEVVGVLKVISPEPAFFGADDVRTLQLMSGLIAAAIARAADYQAKRSILEEQRRAVVALSERDAILRAFFDASPFLMGVVRRETDGVRYLSANLATERFMGSAPGALIGKLAADTGASPEALHAAMAAFTEAERTGHPVFWQYTRGTGDEKRHMSCNISLLPRLEGEANRRFCFVIQDVTSRVLLEQRADLNDRMASVGRLAAGVAHEANNPLAYVIANLNFLSEALREASPHLAEGAWLEISQALNEAQEGAKRVKLIIKDLYTFVRSESEQMEAVDLRTVVERAVAMSGHAVYPRARVERSLKPHPVVQGQPARLGQVVINLLVNAAQAMPSDRGPDQNEIRVATGRWEDGRVFIEVSDNGAGMKPEVMRKVFEPFFTTKPLGNGMGLGLSLCHNIIQAHQGELKVESAQGVGTTFRILLPAS